MVNIIKLQRVLIYIAAVATSVVLSATLAIARTGPTSAPPNGNVAPPINVGPTDQVKNAGLALNSLAAFGNAFLDGRSQRLRHSR